MVATIMFSFVLDDKIAVPMLFINVPLDWFNWPLLDLIKYNLSNGYLSSPIGVPSLYLVKPRLMR